MKVLLFEGIDKVGKTTTIEKIEKVLTDKGYTPLLIKFPFEVQKLTNEQREFRLMLTVDNIISMNNFFDDTFVCLVDRLHLSEEVYGEVLRNEYNQHECNIIDFKMSQLKTILIHVKPDNLMDNFNKFKSQDNLIDGLTCEQYSKTYQSFKKRINESRINKKIGLTTKDLDELVENIEIILKMQ